MAAPTPPQDALLQRVRELVVTEPDVLDDHHLSFWVNTAMTYNRTITGLG